MITLVASALGFATSTLPKVLGYFEDKRKEAHALAMMDKQMEMQAAAGEIHRESASLEARVREIETLHKEHAKITSKASQWAVNLSSSVRPIITYAIFGEFVALSAAVSFGWVTSLDFQLIWSDEMQILFAAVVSFWFGQRTFGHKK